MATDDSGAIERTRPNEPAEPKTLIVTTSNAEHTVVVTVDAPEALLGEMAEHARAGLARFRECDGFLGGALHVTRDGGRLLQYLRWRDEAAYDACIDDPRWDEMPTTAPFLAAVREGRATLDASAYAVVAVS
ncbi:MAG: hypothetical protein ABFS34_05215 [Gemmatimonadota bacterium]